ncbi:MAG: ParM/StbA family protein [Desulfuromonadaceae bacterium]|nr:ParM/StbA family protein [Desulfuromonadaceae bacterium]
MSQEVKAKRMVAVDVGSGFTQYTDGNVEGDFPSLVCTAPENMGFGSEEAEIVTVDGAKYLVGKSAKAFGNPSDRVNTLHDDWGGSTAWKAALYAALARTGIKSGESIDLVTGLPQGFYARQHKSLSESMSGENVFSYKGKNYKVNINLEVIPQASGALFYQASKEQALLQDSVGVIDIGTYTTGFSVVEDGFLNDNRCGSCLVGVSQLAESLQASLLNERGMRIDIAKMPDVLRNKEVRYRGERVDLSEHIERQSLMIAKPMLEKVVKLWDGGDDLLVFVAGGGAVYFADAINSTLPHARIMSDSFHAVVRGMHSWLTTVSQ